ncbi:MAG TPA: protease pro-enzyme activation domain-containing protein [Bryobacteraceae bacterium]|jgi:kumamolisin
MPEPRVPLEASRSRIAAGERAAGVPDPSAPMEASILVRRRSHPGQLDAILSGEAPPLSREEAAATLGADPADLERVIAFAQSYGLTIVESNAVRRTVRVSGTVSQMESAFGITLRSCETGGRSYTCYDGVLSIPAALEGIVVAVLGLDQRPVTRHR